jgi:hypothetical protein
MDRIVYILWFVSYVIVDKSKYRWNCLAIEIPALFQYIAVCVESKMMYVLL